MEIYFKIAMTVAFPSAIITVISMGIVELTDNKSFMLGVGVGIAGVIIGATILGISLLIDMWLET